MIYVFNGIGGSGKDSVIKEISKILAQNKIQTFEFSKADFAKKVMKEKFGWDGLSKEHPDRQALCDITDVATRYNDLPFKNLIKEVEEVKNQGVVFTYIRETEDIKRFQEYFGSENCKTVLVTRFLSDGSLLPDVPHVYTDSYEYINNFEYDRRLTNAHNKILPCVQTFFETEYKNIFDPIKKAS